MNYSIEQELIRMGVNQAYVKPISIALSGIVKRPGVLKMKQKTNMQIIQGKDSGYQIYIEARTKLDDYDRPVPHVAITLNNRNTYIYVDRKVFIMNAKTDKGLFVCDIKGAEKSDLKIRFFDKQAKEFIKKKAEEKPKEAGKNFRVKRNYLKHHDLTNVAKSLGLIQDDGKTIGYSAAKSQGGNYKVANRVIQTMPSIIELRESSYQPRIANSSEQTRYQRPARTYSSVRDQRFEEEVRLENGIPQRKR